MSRDAVRRLARDVALGIMLGLTIATVLPDRAETRRAAELDQAARDADLVDLAREVYVAGPSRTYRADFTSSCACLYSAEGRLLGGDCNPCDPWSPEKQAEIDAIADAVAARMRSAT